MKVIKGNFSGQSKKQKNSLVKKDQIIPIAQEGDENYSTMLIDLIKPYMDADPTAIELEEKVQLGIIAWNLSISKALGVPGYNEILKSSLLEAGFDKKQEKVIKKMSEDKQKKFSGQNSFIENYELKEDSDNRMNVTISCISLMDMMKEDMGIDDEDIDDDDFGDDDLFENEQYEEGIVNRIAFSINHKPALIEWAKKINITPDPGGNIIYLIDEMETEQEAYVWLKKNFRKVMKDELADVTANERKWPKLNYEVFCDFFDVQFYNQVWDMEERPVKKY